MFEKNNSTVKSRIELIAVLLLFSVGGYVFAPFSYSDKRVVVPRDQDLDAIQQTLLVGGGMDKLLTAPLSYYDTAILYPDRHQLRGTEPLLGFAILGLPLRTILRLNDSDVFEALRWAIVFTSLTYAYLLFRAVGIDAAVSAAGAVLCLSQPDLLKGIERLQVVSMPLILPVLYHGLMAWTSGRFRHSVGLFVFAALYPLCGMFNATLSVMAVLFILPLVLKMLAAQPRRERLTACLVPVLLAVALDGAALTPWLLDRWDLTGYVSDAFLQIKHWNEMRLPVRVADIPGFVAGRIGLGVAAELAMLCVLAAIQDADRAVKGQTYLLAVPAVAAGLAVSASSSSGGVVLPWLQPLFQIVCFATLLLYWRDQMRFFISDDETSIRNDVVMLSAGLGVFLCLMSFGPVYVSNGSPLASRIMNVLFYLLPPLKAIREFERIWILGILFLSIYATVRIGTVLRPSSRLTQVSTAVVLVAAAMSSVYGRRLVATENIEAPADFIQFASHSRSAGAIYVHPYMKWNSYSGVWMIPIAAALRRPIVNGYLGIAPPWFDYATRVLHRFPDPESLWLLRTWKVQTVLSLVGNVPGADAFGEKVFEGPYGVIYEITPLPAETPHPSGAACVASDSPVRTQGEASPAERVNGGASMTVRVPHEFRVKRVEISFGPSVIELIPESIDVYALEGSHRVRLNQDRSGEWLQSLAADALVRHKPPVATIRLTGTPRRDFQVDFRGSEKPPIERIGLCGEWTR